MPLLEIQAQRDPKSIRSKSRVLVSSIIGNQGGGGGGGYGLDGGGVNSDGGGGGGTYRL
jgi:hypothetical protein